MICTFKCALWHSWYTIQCRKDFVNSSDIYNLCVRLCEINCHAKYFLCSILVLHEHKFCVVGRLWPVSLELTVFHVWPYNGKIHKSSTIP